MKGIIRELTKCKSCKYWIEEATTSGHADCIIFIVRGFNGETHRIKTTKKLFEDDFYNFLSFDLNVPLLDKKNYIIEYHKDSIVFKESGKEKRIVYTLRCHNTLSCELLFIPISISVKSDLSTSINKLSIKCELTKRATEILKMEGELKFIMNYVPSPNSVLEYIKSVNKGNRLLSLFNPCFIMQANIKIKNSKMHIKYSIPAFPSVDKSAMQAENPNGAACNPSFLYNGPIHLFQAQRIATGITGDRILELIEIMNNATDFNYSFDESNGVITLTHNELVLSSVPFTIEEFKQASIEKYIIDNECRIDNFEKEALCTRVKFQFQSYQINVGFKDSDLCIMRLPFRRYEK